MNKVVLKCINVAPLDGNTVAPPLTLEAEYSPAHVHKCKCGNVHFDVGLKSQYNFITCWHCKEVLPNSETGGTHWCHPSRFEKVS